jgi:hypothetical protein
MTMIQKIVFISIIVGAVVVSYIILFAIHDFFNEAAAIATAGNVGDNFTGYNAALNSSPWWIMFIPGLVGIVSIIMVMRAPERMGG